MQLKSLVIRHRESYESNPGKFMAEVRFDTKEGSMDLPLAPEVGEKLMEVLTPVIVDFSKKAAEQLGELMRRSLEERKTKAIDLPKE